MKQTYKLLTLLVCLMMASWSSQANDGIMVRDTVDNCQQTCVKREYSKTIDKQFPITVDGTVKISNRYGKVEIKTWENNEVKVEVVITVDAHSQDKADDVFDRVTVDFNSSRDFVSATTEIASKSGWSSWWGGSSSNDNYKINYEVYMPKTNKLDLFNKYGDSYVAALKGRVNLEIKYGNIQLEQVDNDVQLMLGYGNASIAGAQGLGLEVKYSKVKVGIVKDVDIVSKYSTVTIDEAQDIRSETKYDHYHLGMVKDYHNIGKYDDVRIKLATSVRAVAKYSDYTVVHLKDWADFDLEYGSASVERLDRAFTAVEIRGRYTDYKIEVEEGTHYQLDASSRYANIRYPSELTVVKEIKDGQEREVEGFVGDKNQAKVIKARLDYGGIKVRQ